MERMKYITPNVELLYLNSDILTESSGETDPKHDAGGELGAVPLT